jgi:hypothetical protein
MFHKDYSPPMVSGLFRQRPSNSAEFRKNGAFWATFWATVLGFLNTFTEDGSERSVYKALYEQRSSQKREC